MNSVLLENAQIDWREGVPFSTQFHDIYFSRTDGFEETIHTFINGNSLLERWDQHSYSGDFVIAELGFGTGLNFLSTLYHWQLQAPKENWLEYHSVEKFPLTQRDLIQAKSQWPQFEGLGDELIEQYPLPFKGIWQIVFPKQRVRLYLYWMDIKEAIAHWQSQPSLQVNAWFLDGFAPAKNPELWQNQGFQCITQHSANNSTLATFTAAGFVRRGLQDCGWLISKRKGFGSKREMLVGQLSSSNELKIPVINTPPWFACKTIRQPPQKIAVIGAGIAGCTTARYLAEAGLTVTLIEESSQAAEGASGNSAGIFYPFLSADLNQTTQFFLHAYHRTLHDLNRFNLMPWVNPIGVLNLAQDLAEQKKLISTFDGNDEFERWIKAMNEAVTAEQFKELKHRVGIYFPESGYIQPQNICQQLIEHSNIVTHFNTHISKIDYQNTHWSVTGKEYYETFDALVICNSFKASELLPLHFLPSIKVRGQTLETSLQQTGLSKPKTVVCDQIYIIPLEKDNLYVGATFERDSDIENLSIEGQNELYKKLEQLTNCSIEKSTELKGRVGFRLCSVDRLPFVGPLPKLENFLISYQNLWQGKPHSYYEKGEYWPNLYTNIAHGARGITSSFLCASIISEYIAQKPLSLTADLAQQIHPARSLIRELKKHPDKRLPTIQTWSQQLQEQKI